VLIALGDIYTQIPSRKDVVAVMLATQESVRNTPGCLGYSFAEAIDEPGRFVVVQRWSDRAAIEAHYASRAFADYQERIARFLTRTSELEIHDVGASVRPFDAAEIRPADD
jgi:quinol monooxygenase YgiN